MSESENAASTPAQEESQSDFVLDFLYHDVARVGSFLAQFDDSGHLQHVTQSETISRGAKRGWKAAAGGALPGIGSANVSVEKEPTTGAAEGSERAYDPLWSNARTLLDYLADRDMIIRGLTGARIGNFVLVSGILMILDLPMIKRAWDIKGIRDLVEAGANQSEQSGLNRQQRRAGANQISGGEKKSPIGMILELVSLMPHALQARLAGQDGSVWCSLNEESVVGKAADITLKHGAVLQGEWQMLGILDALPDAPHTDEQTSILSAFVGTPVGQLVATLAPNVRLFLGRPHDAFGVTPLLIYRSVIV